MSKVTEPTNTLKDTFKINSLQYTIKILFNQIKENYSKIWNIQQELNVSINNINYMMEKFEQFDKKLEQLDEKLDKLKNKKNNLISV